MNRAGCGLAMLAMMLPALSQAGSPADPGKLVEMYRQTESTEVLEQCKASIRTVLRQTPQDANARLAEAKLDLLTGRTAEALQAGLRLNRESPDDLETYAVLVDAYRKLGNLREAEKATQWMLDLRPWDLRGLTRAAALRADFGDTAGAVDLYTECYKKAFPTDRVVRAEILTDLAGLYRKTGRGMEADGLLQEALKLMPGYRPAERMSGEKK